MNVGPLFSFFTLAAFSLVVVSGRCASPGGGDLPGPAIVMSNVVRRSEDTARADEADKYCFEKRSVEEELDASGKATKTTEETYEVIPIHGIPFSRLVKIQGKELTEKQVKEQNRKEEEFRKKLAEQESGQSSTTNKDSLDKDLINRFAFQVERRENLQGRPVLVLSFRPKANRGPEKTVADKVLNRLAGTLWVDEQESEIAQLKVGLTADLSLGWFGMIGSLKQFDLTLERERLPDGVWVDRKQTLVLAGRKVFSTMRHRTVEESSKFRKP